MIFSARSEWLALPALSQTGFVLISVLVSLTLLASVVMLINQSNQMLVRIHADETDRDRLFYMTEAGLAHAQWTLTNNTSCTGYTDVARQAFNTGTYEVEITPVSGSPVSLTATGELANSVTMTRTRNNIKTYAAPQTTTLSVIEDTYIKGKSNDLNKNYSTSNSMHLRANDAEEERPMLRFDLSELPSNAVVRSAVLELSADATAAKMTGLTAHQITRDWTGSATTWLNADSSTLWNSPGADFDTNPSASFSKEPGNMMVAEIGHLVNGWHSGLLPNYGLIVIADDANGNTHGTFDSNEGSGDFGAKLRIEYACECGEVCTAGESGKKPIAHWALDDGVGVAATDQVGGHNGTTQGSPTWISGGKVDGALNFDGSNDTIRVPHDSALSITDELTISAWLYGTGFSFSNYYRVLSKESPGANDNYWLAVFSGEVAFGIGGAIYSTVSLNLQAGRWYHLALTFDDAADDARLYLDGVLVDSFVVTATITPNKDSLWIGSNGSSKFFEGYLDDVRLYDQALTAAEILDLPGVDSGGGGTGGTGCNGSYADNLDAISFSGSNGSIDWSGSPFIEVGEFNGPDSGDIRIMQDLGELALRLRDNDNGGEGVERQVDLTGAATATFSYFYSRVNLDSSSDYASVQISANGSGGPWTELTRHTGPGTDSSYISMSFDISAYASPNTRLRFITSSSMGNSDEVYFDDFSVVCRP